MNLKTVFPTLFLLFNLSDAASDSITIPQLLRDPETLISRNGNFELGFFSPPASTNRYLGIWFNKQENPGSPLEVVWVANRDNPIQGPSSMFKVSEDGNLQVTDEENNIFWSANVSYRGQGKSVQLQNTGNLVLLPNGSNSVIWQSFDHPTDSLLPGSKITLQKSLNDTKTKIQSWKSSSDPSSGRFRIVSLPQALPEFFIVEGDTVRWRSGPWNGNMFLGVPYVRSVVSQGFNVDDHDDTLDLSYDVPNTPFLERFTLTYDGVLTQKIWNDTHWVFGWRSLQSECDVYGKCGKYAVCNPKKKPICECLKGFNPVNTNEWRKGNWTNGCIRRKALQCQDPGSKEDKFLQMKHIKVPDYANWIVADQDNCERNCKGNCSCVAYSFYTGVGCMYWTSKLIDLQQFSADGADVFVRLAHSELPDVSGKQKIVIAVIVILIALVSFAMVYVWRWTRHRKGKKAMPVPTPIPISVPKEANWHDIFGGTDGNHDHDFHDLRLFDFTKLVAATDNFSELNKLGQGGFGPVYKGKWEDGQDIAVKRLSNTSGQGVEEFLNEVMVISRLQHKNLVRLLGCCAEGEEKLLVYELMPNKSLDALLFDPKQQNVLDWPKRFSIIQGICRGLLYLHRDSRLRIIHRDLKPSNILLDEELNPKISDFGMARIFGSKQDEASTLRIVGTYGYMSPEYAMEGTFSEKSDVFGLGVLILEIINGKKNHRFLGQESSSLLTYAWKLWKENDMLSLINPEILDQSSKDQILKCIQVGLLCVQEFSEERPDVSAMISMLDIDDVRTLPIPKPPGFTRNKGYSSDEFLQHVYDYSLTDTGSKSTASGH